jgi:hypothetical protein
MRGNDNILLAKDKQKVKKNESGDYSATLRYMCLKCGVEYKEKVGENKGYPNCKGKKG